MQIYFYLINDVKLMSKNTLVGVIKKNYSYGKPKSWKIRIYDPNKAAGYMYGDNSICIV